MRKDGCNYFFYITVCASCFLTAGCDKPQETKMADQTKAVPINENIKTLASGLKLEVLQAAPANAKQPTAGKKVTVHYTGWLDENGKLGKKFDSSVDRNEKFTFIVGIGQVIKGWDEGIMNMHVGEKCRFTIPAHLGYGARGAGGVIPGNATLIFDVELFDVA